MLKRTAAGAGVAAAALAAPNITGIGTAPAFAEGCSAAVNCQDSLNTTLTLSIDQVADFGNIAATVTPSSSGACSLNFVVPAKDFPSPVEGALVTLALSTGETESFTVLPNAETNVTAPFDCTPQCTGDTVTPISIMSGSGFLTITSVPVDQPAVVNASSSSNIVVCP